MFLFRLMLRSGKCCFSPLPFCNFGVNDRSDDSSSSVREVLQVELWAKARCNRCGDVLCHRSFWGVMVLVLGAMVLGCRSAAQGQQ